MFPNAQVDISEFDSIQEISGKLSITDDEDKLMHSVLENDADTIDKGNVIKDSINLGIGSFTADIMFEQFVKDYKQAEKILGEKIIRFITGYDPSYVERNIRIPEFQRELSKRINENIEKLRDLKLIDNDGIITDKGYDLASVTLYIEELNNIIPKGIFGERVHKKQSFYGAREDVEQFKKGHSYRDVAIKRTIKTAIRRNHQDIQVNDLRIFQRASKGMTYIIYGMDCSGSMKGKKIEVAKKAGIALAFKAINKKDKVGLITFGSDIKESIEPTEDFPSLVRMIVRARSGGETNIVNILKKSAELFPGDDVTKHLILLTDALPTVGTEEETLTEVSNARAAGVTISLVGINLDDKGTELAKKIVEYGQGRFYTVKNLDELDKIILEDYYEIM